MPSQNEIIALQASEPSLRVWGVLPANVSEPHRLGEVAVVPFDDVAALLHSRGERARASERELHIELLEECLTHTQDLGLAALLYGLLIAQIPSIGWEEVFARACRQSQLMAGRRGGDS